VAVRSFQVLGVELAPYVLDWGSVEEVKDVLFAQTQLFTSEHTLKLENADGIQGSSAFGQFSPGVKQSIFYGRNVQLLPTVLSLDGLQLFYGLTRSFDVDHATKTISIISQNWFTQAAATNAVLTATGNPAYIIQQLLVGAGLTQYINFQSFAAASGGFAVAGATISVNYTAASNTSVLSAIQAVSSLCGLSCYVRAGQFVLQAWTPYQGNNSAIKYAITASTAYNFGTLSYAYENLSNSVTITYGANLTYTLTNPVSIQANGITTSTAFSAANGSAVDVPNAVSAAYFASQFLKRASNLRRMGTLTGGPGLTGVHIGDRVTVAAPNWSSSPIPFEVIETHLQIQSNSIQLSLVEMPVLTGGAL
jgi:hypothetical protein